MAVALQPPYASPPVESDVPGRVARLRASFDNGLTRSLMWRREQLDRLAAMIRENREGLLDALRADLGTPEVEAVTADLEQVTREARYARRRLHGWARPERVAWFPLRGRRQVLREPLGVVLIVAPWNYPVGLLLSPLVGALAAGNCALLKPSEVAAHTSALLARLIPRYLDPDAVAVVEGGAEETGELLAQRFDHIFFTGGSGAGREVMAAAARHLTPVTLELGGKCPCIVDADTNLRVAARRIAWGKFRHAGQSCIAPDYVLVHERRESELVAELRDAIREFYGDDPASSPDYARIVGPQHFARLVAQLGDGEIAVGGQSDPESLYIAPTVMRRVLPDSGIMRAEIFGPLLPILPVSSITEAIDFVCDRDKPLALYLFSDDEEVRRSVLDHTSSGGVCVNDTMLQASDPRLPFGGVGESGFGAYHGRHGFETFSHRKSVLVQGRRSGSRGSYPPYPRSRNGSSGRS